MQTKIAAPLLAVLFLLTASVPLAVADDVKFTIRDGRLSNLSGLTVAGDAIFGVNENDDKVRVYRINPDSGRVNRSSVESISVSALNAIGSDTGHLYVADLSGSKSVAKVMKFAVPEAAVDPEAQSVTTAELKYPEGDRVGQAMFVSPAGKVFIVAEGDIYSGPDSLSGDAVLVKVGRAPDGVTGGSFIADGKVGLRTDTEVFLMDANSWTVVSKAKIEGAGTGSVIAGAGDSVYLAGKGARQAVYAKPLSAFSPVAPQPDPTTAPSAGPSAAESSATATEPTSPDSSATQSVSPTPSNRNNAGTLLAILAAALVAGGMGIIVFVKK